MMSRRVRFDRAITRIDYEPISLDPKIPDWCVVACDRERFHRRIRHLETILLPVLLKRFS